MNDSLHFKAITVHFPDGTPEHDDRPSALFAYSATVATGKIYLLSTGTNVPTVVFVPDAQAAAPTSFEVKLKGKAVPGKRNTYGVDLDGKVTVSTATKRKKK